MRLVKRLAQVVGRKVMWNSFHPLRVSEQIRHSIEKLDRAVSFASSLEEIQDLRKKYKSLLQDVDRFRLQHNLRRPAAAKNAPDYRDQLRSWRKKMEEFGLVDLTEDTPGDIIEPVRKKLWAKERLLKNEQFDAQPYFLPEHLAQIAAQRDESAQIRSVTNASFEELPTPRVPEYHRNPSLLEEHLSEKAAQKEDFAQMLSIYGCFYENNELRA